MPKAQTPWRLITTLGAPPNFNMGLDEALLELGGAPTLRLYTWQPDTLSLGYFQKYAEVPGVARASHVVRRITGGGAIHHAEELTFSLTTDLGDPIYQGPVARSYERVHFAVIQALAAVGVDAALRQDQPLVSDVEGTGMCFHHSTPLDIAWLGRKGVGSAQRRRAGRVLHHGSIKLKSTELEGAIATTGECGPCQTPLDLIPHLCLAFEHELGMQLRRDVPTAAERERAVSLEPRYSAAAFLRRR